VWRAAGIPTASETARGLQLVGYHAVDVEPALAPDLDIFGARGARDRLRAARDAPCERAGHEVRVVARRAGDHEIRVGDAGVQQREPVQDNAQLVARAVRIAAQLDRPPATPQQARELLALRGREPAAVP
jgi:hypothetical protein